MMDSMGLPVPSGDPLSACDLADGWAGPVTWRQVADLREGLFDLLDRCRAGVALDVRMVTEMDRTGAALLIGANHRATALRRRLVIVPGDDPVMRTLRGLNAAAAFEIVDTDTVPSRQSATDHPDRRPHSRADAG